MKWLKRKIRDWVNDADRMDKRYDDHDEDCWPNSTSSLSSPKETLQHSDFIMFKVYSAKGGRIVEVRKVSDSKIRNNDNTNLYVVQNDENFGDEIAKIIFLEGLSS